MLHPLMKRINLEKVDSFGGVALFRAAAVATAAAPTILAPSFIVDCGC